MLNCDDGRVDTSLHYENQLEFATREEAKKWVVEKGKEINCIIVSGNQSASKRFEMLCKRSGNSKSHVAKDYLYIKKSSRKIYKKRISKKCECPFKIVFNKSDDVWRMKVVNGCHNHEDEESLVGQPVDAKLKPQESAQLQMLNCDDGLGAVGVRPNYFRRPPPTPSQDNWMMGWIGASSQMQPVSSSMRSPTPASNQPVAVTQASIDELEHFSSTEPNTRRVQPILLAWKSLTKEKENDISVDRKVIKFNDDRLVTSVTGLLKIISVMETVRGAEVSEELLEEWEGFIQDAESLEFNIKWLRERFNQLMNRRRSSLATDKEIES